MIPEFGYAYGVADFKCKDNGNVQYILLGFKLNKGCEIIVKTNYFTDLDSILSIG